MSIAQPITKKSLYIRAVRDYTEVLKPRASLLLTFIGVCAAIVAGRGILNPGLLLVAFTIFVAAAGANGMTNYLDCGIDAMMQRTRGRALPSRRIEPPERVLPLTIGLIIIGLVLAWQLHPLALVADLAGTLAAIIYRKRATCVFPQGMIASCAPVLMGWFAVRPAVSWELLFMCILIGVWLPLHVWSVMIANRQDYLNAGLKYFPVNREVRDSVKVLLAFSIILYGASIALYFTGDFGRLYLIAASLLGAVMVYATGRMVVRKAAAEAWWLYKFSSFPYLGIIFLVMCLDIWLFK